MMEASPSHRQLGTQAEEEACAWYLKQGPSRLIARNYFTRSGEIDLIFEDKLASGVELVFVEVKSRKENSYLGALDSLSAVKKRRLKRAVLHFLSRYTGAAQTIRVDLLAQDGGVWTHLKSIELR